MKYLEGLKEIFKYVETYTIIFAAVTFMAAIYIIWIRESSAVTYGIVTALMAAGLYLILVSIALIKKHSS